MDRPAKLRLNPDFPVPDLPLWKPLPEADPDFSAEIAEMVHETGIDELCPASRHPDGYEESCSVCVVDLREKSAPRVGEMDGMNFVYPAATYILYILGEAYHQHVLGRYSLEDEIHVKPHNIVPHSLIKEPVVIRIGELLRLTSSACDLTAANETIDLIDRQRASATLRGLGLDGSDITRKYLTRDREDEGYEDVPGTYSSARHLASYLYAVENSVLGGGRGRGLIKGGLVTMDRRYEYFRPGLPTSATIYAQGGAWNTFTGEAALIEEGPLKYIFTVLVPLPVDVARTRLARLAKLVHDSIEKKYHLQGA